MSKKNHRNLNDTIQEWAEIQDHRYDPGYWTTKVKGGGLTPLGKRIGGVHFSSFSRALIMFLVLAGVPIGFFLNLRDRLPYAGFWCAITVVALFLALWHLTRRSAIRSEQTEHRKPR